MKKIIKDYFTFTHRERNGIIVLLIIISAGIVIKHLNLLDRKEDNYDYSSFEEEVRAFENSISTKEPEETKNHTSTIQQQSHLFYFDPNSISNKQWKELGLDKKVINTINNYTSKGGSFKKKSDLKKIYGLDHKLYSRLEPYIIIDTLNFEANHLKEFEYILDLNTVDSVNLIKIKGIGKVLSLRIIKYRNLLGGYTSKEQLLEVYGINKDIYMQIEKYFIIDTNYINKISLKNTTINALNKHPYISKYDAQAIMAFIQQQKYILEINELERNNIISTEKLNKIRPYLSLD